MQLEQLRDAAGNVVAVDACECGRPKPASQPYCCKGCFGQGAPWAQHMSGCAMRCATLGVPGFGVLASDVYPTRGRPFPVPAGARLLEDEMGDIFAGLEIRRLRRG